MSDPGPRRRCQFRLRMLLIAVALLAVVFALVRWRFDFVRQPKVMIRRILVDYETAVHVAVAIASS